MRLLYVFLLLLTIGYSCGFETQNENKSVNNSNENSKEEIVETDVKVEKDTIVKTESDSIINYPEVKLKDDYNDIALFLAGNRLPKKSPYYDLTQDSSFILYARSVNSKFKSYKEKQLVKISSWTSNKLAEVHQNSSEIFYPFSGPDAVHAITVFPKGKNYYLFGLEPVGSIPDLQNIPVDSLDKLFSILNKSMSDNLNLSFFITKKMYKDLHTKYLDGTIPILLFFLSKLNYHIQDIRPVKITAEGILEGKDRTIKNNFTNFGRGVEFTFVDTSTNEVKKLYYFSTDISDYGLKKSPEIKTFIESLADPIATLIKSASYCPHGEKFQIIHDVIRDKSKYLLQDDTGLPYAHFDAKNWDIKLFGKYDKPVNVFKEMYQDDFKKAMDEKAEPVDFRFGYTKDANILFGVKK